MADYLKAFALPLIMQICLGLGSAAIAAIAINARIEERIVHIEQRNQEQDTRLEALRQRSEDLGLQMARLESMRSDLAEVKGDVKSLLRERVGARYKGGVMAVKATQKATPKKERHNKFLAALCVYGNVTRAAEVAGLDRTALYNKRKVDPTFSAAWDEAEALGVAALEDEARRRAYEGWEEPVWHKGVNCGTVRKFSDTLLIVLLKAHMPEKYRENIKIDLNSRIATMSLEEKLAEAQRIAGELGVTLS